jgi:tRNA(Ile2) C34 agmatinyltransferase TiaS
MKVPCSFCGKDVEAGGKCRKCGTSDSTSARESRASAQENAWYGVNATTEREHDLLGSVGMRRRVRAEKKAD